MASGKKTAQKGPQTVQKFSRALLGSIVPVCAKACRVVETIDNTRLNKIYVLRRLRYKDCASFLTYCYSIRKERGRV
jgi:hypothetical protein